MPLQRILDSYGGYATHLSALAADASVKAANRAQISGYLKKVVTGENDFMVCHSLRSKRSLLCFNALDQHTCGERSSKPNEYNKVLTVDEVFE